jgi:chaperone required for assembly of F1-ATPase
MALRDPYPLDHLDRFYGFNSLEQEESHALKLIQASIDTINNYKPVITRQITTVADQDTLNYLHSIFEQYHGLLDQQSQEFFKTAPPEVKMALGGPMKFDMMNAGISVPHVIDCLEIVD